MDKLEEKECLKKINGPSSDIVEELKQAVCNKKENGVCCSSPEDQTSRFSKRKRRDAQIHEEIPDQEMKVKDLIRKVRPALQRLAKKALQKSMADFTQSMYLHLAQQTDLTNFVFSPLLLHASLSMLFLGATDGSNTSEAIRAK